MFAPQSDLIPSLLVFEQRLQAHGLIPADQPCTTASATWLLSPAHLEPQSPEDLLAAVTYHEGAHEGAPSMAQAGLRLLDQPLSNWGLAILESVYEEDVVQDHQGHKWQLPRMNLLLDPNSLDPSLGPDPLAWLFMQVRSLLGERDWLVYWGLKGGVYSLLAVRPWGPACPVAWLQAIDLPCPTRLQPLSTGILQAAADEWRVRLDSSLLDVEHQPYVWLEHLGGHLWWNQTELQRLLKANSGKTHLLKQGWQIWQVKRACRQATRGMWETFLIPHSRLPGFLDQWQEILRLFLGPFWQLSQQMQTLHQRLEQGEGIQGFLSRHLSPSSRMQHRLYPLRETVQQMIINQDGKRPSIAQLLRYPEFRKSWQLFLSDFGHFSASGFDLKTPRFADQPRLLLDAMMLPWRLERPSQDETWREWLSQPIWLVYKDLHEHREQLISDTLWALHQVRQRLLEHLQPLIAAGHLKHEDEFWLLWPEEARQLESEAINRQLLAQRKRLWLIDPAGIQPESSPQQALSGQAASDLNYPLEIPAIGLNNGLAQGLAWCLLEAQFAPPAGMIPKQTILVAPNVDTGWIPCLTQVAGVILTQAQPHSRSALLLQELNLPTLILNQPIDLQTGQELRVNADTNQLVILTPAPDLAKNDLAKPAIQSEPESQADALIETLTDTSPPLTTESESV